MHDLSRDVSLEDLASQLPYEEAELEDLQEPLRIPGGLEQELAEEAERMERERPRILSFALSPQQAEIVEAAIDRVRAPQVGRRCDGKAGGLNSTDAGRDA